MWEVCLPRLKPSAAVVGLLFAIVLVPTARSEEPKLSISGYDPVAYFSDGKPVQGKTEFEYLWHKLRWRFASGEHRESFAKDPDRYTPQYDGYCALAIGAQKKRVNINPETFKVTQGRLYLFYNSTHSLSGNRFNSLEPWIKDEDRLIQKSDENWRVMKPKGK